MTLFRATQTSPPKKQTALQQELIVWFYLLVQYLIPRKLPWLWDVWTFFCFLRRCFLPFKYSIFFSPSRCSFLYLCYYGRLNSRFLLFSRDKKLSCTYGCWENYPIRKLQLHPQSLSTLPLRIFNHMHLRFPNYFTVIPWKVSNCMLYSVAWWNLAGLAPSLQRCESSLCPVHPAVDTPFPLVT